MSTPLQVAQDFKNLYNNILGANQLALFRTTTRLRGLLQAHSPVGSTGEFKASWSSRTVAYDTMEVFNESPAAQALAHGSLIGSSPWPSAAKRTVNLGGRIWSSQAVGGVVDTLLDSSIGKELADFMVAEIKKGFKW